MGASVSNAFFTVRCPFASVPCDIRYDCDSDGDRDTLDGTYIIFSMHDTYIHIDMDLTVMMSRYRICDAPDDIITASRLSYRGKSHRHHLQSCHGHVEYSPFKSSKAENKVRFPRFEIDPGTLSKPRHDI